MEGMMETTTNYCPRHPRIETNLRCGKCEELICSECLVHTPVGVRCPQCVQQSRVPTYDVPRIYLARAIAAGFGVGIAGGLVMAFLTNILLSIRFIDSLVLIALAYLIGEVVSIAANRKRGRKLQFVAATSVLATFITIVLVSRTVVSGFTLIIAFYIAFWKVGR